jgi:hypothetical protein
MQLFASKNVSNSLEKERVATALEGIIENKKIILAILAASACLSSVLSLSFLDFFSSLLLSLFVGFIAYFIPFVATIIFLVIVFLAFSYQSSFLGLLFLFLILGVGFFEFSNNWQTFLLIFLLVFLQFSFWFLGGLLTIFLLAVSSFYFGSKRAIFLGAIVIFFSLLLDAILPIKSFLFFPSNQKFLVVESFKPPVSLANFLIQSINSLAGVFSFSNFFGFFGNLAYVL